MRCAWLSETGLTYYAKSNALMSPRRARLREGLVLIRMMLAGLALCVFSTISRADSSLWQISRGGHQLFLGGTIHLLRDSDYPLPVEFEWAYQRASKLVFETDLQQLQQPAVQQRMQQALTYPQGSGLRQRVSAAVYAQVARKWQALGMPLALLDRFRPGGVVMALTVAQMRVEGVDAEGIDMYFHQRAVQARKPVVGLESVERQVAYLAQMGEGVEDEFLRQSLLELEQSSQFMDELVAAWRRGDQAALERLILLDMRTEFPGLYASLLVERNQHWLPQIKRLLEDRPTELVLVGAGHLVGSDGLLQQLAAQGYQVRQVNLEQAD